jgi:hypothetical protein
MLLIAIILAGVSVAAVAYAVVADVDPYPPYPVAYPPTVARRSMYRLLAALMFPAVVVLLILFDVKPFAKTLYNLIRFQAKWDNDWADPLAFVKETAQAIFGK